MKNWNKVVLALIIIAGFFVRLYRIDNPIADWHAWRQADTSAVSRNFIEYDFDVLHPKFNDISNIPSGKDNPEGYRFVEFPIYNIHQAVFYKIFDYFSLETWGRLTTVFASLLSIFFLYSLVKKYSHEYIGLLSAFFFAFLPYSIYYSRTILPDQMMVTASLGSIYFFDKWIEGNSKFKVKNAKLQFKNQNFSYYILGILFISAAFLLKPFALFFTLPLIYIAWKRFGLGVFKQWQLWLFAALSIAPLVAWRIWIAHYPEGIPASNWLFNGNGIRFKPIFFYWVFYERITILILGYISIVFFLLGLFSLKKIKNSGFFVSFLLSSLLYIVVIATGNVQHDYYQILIIPSLAMFCGIGVSFLFTVSKKQYLKAALVISLFLACIIQWVGYPYINQKGLVTKWSGIKDYFNINNRAIVVAGRAADTILPKNAKVIAPYDGDTSFLYYIHRKGWPAFEKSPDELVHMGATHMVLVNPTENDINGFGKKYKVLARAKEYLILKLK